MIRLSKRKNYFFQLTDKSVAVEIPERCVEYADAIRQHTGIDFFSVNYLVARFIRDHFFPRATLLRRQPGDYYQIGDIDVPCRPVYNTLDVFVGGRTIIFADQSLAERAQEIFESPEFKDYCNPTKWRTK